MAVQFILAPSAALAKEVDATVTIEAEYGSVVVEGSLYTAAHHQKGMENLPAPCNDPEMPTLEEGAVLVSHLDLDTIGGCLRTLRRCAFLFEEKYEGFWKLAHFVDINGPHKLLNSGASSKDLLRLYAFWAWSKAELPRFSQESLSDVSRYIISAGVAIRQIFKNDTVLVNAGKEMLRDENSLNVATLQEVRGGVLLRKTNDSTGFCNHLYTDTGGQPFKAVASYNTTQGSITISLADPIEGVSCRDVMQNMFGPEAGGHDGIAGSPREKEMTYLQFEGVANKLSELVV